MAKRFTDTNKYKKPFIRGLQGGYKVLWDYLYHDCDHAGIWIVDFEIAQIYVGADLPINKADALKYFNESEERIIEIDHGTKWFIPSFISFQYGELKESNRAHNSVINILKNKGLISSLQGAKDKDKDMVKDMVKDKDKEEEKEKEKPETKVEIWPTFEDFWTAYAKKVGSKEKCKQKFDKLNQDTKEIIMNHVFDYVKSTPDKQYRANPETFFNQKRWENEIIINSNGKQQNNKDQEQFDRLMSDLDRERDSQQ